MEHSNQLETSCFESCEFLEKLMSYSRILTVCKVGLPYVEHDKRYDNADEYLRVLYK